MKNHFHPKLRGASCLLLLLALLPILTATFFTTSAEARVYSLTGGKSFAEGLGWSVAYSTKMDINGRPADVQVWSSPDRFFRSMAKLQDAWRARGIREGFVAGQEMGWGMVVEDDRLIRYLVINMEGRAGTVVYQTSQKIEDARASMKRKSVPQMEAVPTYPGAKPLSYLADKDSGMEVEVTETRAPVFQVVNWFDGQMDSLGWKNDVMAEGSRIYQKGQLRMYLGLKRGETGGTVISSVFKKSGLKSK